MEVIKTLPAVFEEFSEQRRNSFLHAYEIKEKISRLSEPFAPIHRMKSSWQQERFRSDCAPSRMKPSQKQSRTCPETSAHW